jgi:hypothetical protein
MNGVASTFRRFGQLRLSMLHDPVMHPDAEARMSPPLLPCARWIRPTSLVRAALVALVGTLLAACSHSSDTALKSFEGRITLHTADAKGTATDFTIAAKGDVLRIDMPFSNAKPGEVALGHAVYEHATNRVRLFFDSTKEYRDMDLSKRIAEDDGKGAPPLESKGSHQTLAGVPCDDWSVKTPDGGHTDVCLAKGLAYLEMFRVHLGPHRTESSLAREYREHSTFPLQMVEYGADGKERARMEVTKVARDSVDDDAFTLPPAYAKVDPHFDEPSPSGSREQTGKKPPR